MLEEIKPTLSIYADFPLHLQELIKEEVKNQGNSFNPRSSKSSSNGFHWASSIMGPDFWGSILEYGNMDRHIFKGSMTIEKLGGFKNNGYVIHVCTSPVIRSLGDLFSLELSIFNNYLNNLHFNPINLAELVRLQTYKEGYFDFFCIKNFYLIVKFPLKILLRKFYEHFNKDFDIIDIKTLNKRELVIYFSILFNLKFIKKHPINGYF